MNANISDFKDFETANTNLASAKQRAEFLHTKRHCSVMELCVGPSLKRLEQCYNQFDIDCWGNDIEQRWADYYPKGKWIIGDAITLPQNFNLGCFDCIVFAPPLSNGCSGRREDSLMIEQVQPSYYDFIEAYKHFNCALVLTLPARSLATSQDKEQYWKLINHICKLGFNFEEHQLFCSKGKVRKYVDLYLTK